MKVFIIFFKLHNINFFKFFRVFNIITHGKLSHSHKINILRQCILIKDMISLSSAGVHKASKANKAGKTSEKLISHFRRGEILGHENKVYFKLNKS